MVSSTPTSEDSESQLMSDVGCPNWHTEDCSTPGSPDSDFDELFSQFTRIDQDGAASWGSYWHAVGWLGLDDLSKPAPSEVEMKDVPPAVIEPRQEPAEAIPPDLDPEADPQEPAEATSQGSTNSDFESRQRSAKAIAPDLVTEAHPQEPADATTAELTPESAPKELAEATSPELVHGADPIVGEKLHNKEELQSLNSTKAETHVQRVQAAQNQDPTAVQFTNAELDIEVQERGKLGEFMHDTFRRRKGKDNLVVIMGLAPWTNFAAADQAGWTEGTLSAAQRRRLWKEHETPGHIIVVKWENNVMTVYDPSWSVNSRTYYRGGKVLRLHEISGWSLVVALPRAINKEGTNVRLIQGGGDGNQYGQC
ncbi:hypothetical protein VC83_05135 [Pseudogymnoascus destructans]|nr:uncharacterized protein VC83_05135 [Pseudogymnoascus destructans]OAF58581.1 hypothetical protein VC83_05135 [Pseudogymnoascus destructans]